MTVSDIMKMLPHRPPFLLVDKIHEISKEHVIGSKGVTMNEFFLMVISREHQLCQVF